MRLEKDIIVDPLDTLGQLKFSALRRERFEVDEEGKPTEKVLKRTYDLKSSAQKQMIQVSLPPHVAVKEFEYDAEVELVNPEVGAVANTTFSGAVATWYVRADDIVLKKKTGIPNQSGNQNPRPENNNGLK